MKDTEWLVERFIECRDALACAVNLLTPSEEGNQAEVSIPNTRLQWLTQKLDEATKLADELLYDTEPEIPDRQERS